MRDKLARPFRNLPIERKLLLASVIPLAALMMLSLQTYRSVEVFSQDEDDLQRIYQAQALSSEYMRLAVDLETGFRGYTLTNQDSFLRPYQTAREGILVLGNMLEGLVSEDPPQRELIAGVQRLVEQMVQEKEGLIQQLKEGQQAEAEHYIEEGQGRVLMAGIRNGMARFTALQRNLLNTKLSSASLDRTSLLYVVLWGGALTLGLTVLALHLVARSITGPLIGLARAVGGAPSGAVPAVPILERQDEIGHLTQVMHAMSVQIKEHLSRLEESESELRGVNQDLSSSEAKYRSLVDHAPFGIFTTKGMSVTFSNRYNQILAGLDPNDQMDPETFRASIHPADRQRVLSEFAQAVEEDRSCETVFRFQQRDGTVRKVLSRRIPVKDAAGQTIMYQGFNIDITALDLLQERLSRSERLATLGQVAAGIAHEIRNPLVGIGSTTALLMDDTPASDPRHAELAIILRETRRLDRIVNQIIDYARPREVAPITFAVEDLLSETVQLLESSLSAKRIVLSMEVPPNLLMLHADRDQLKQVLLNLIQNAVEASSEGGRITLGAFSMPGDRGAGLVVKVVDAGCGIHSEDLAHAFEPFFTKGKHRGTGLGLAICRNIIEAHGGDIQLTSEVGKGTSARIWLPVRQDVTVMEG